MRKKGMKNKIHGNNEKDLIETYKKYDKISIILDNEQLEELCELIKINAPNASIHTDDTERLLFLIIDNYIPKDDYKDNFIKLLDYVFNDVDTIHIDIELPLVNQTIKRPNTMYY